MITFEQAKRGITKYIDNDILPKLTGMRRLGLGMYAALAAQNFEKTLMRYKDNPAISMLDIVDDNNMIDIDRIYSAATPWFEGRMSIDLPLLGTLTVDRGDLDRLYRFMREG